MLTFTYTHLICTHMQSHILRVCMYVQVMYVFMALMASHILSLVITDMVQSQTNTVISGFDSK